MEEAETSIEREDPRVGTAARGQLQRLTGAVRRALVVRHLLRWTAVVATVVGAAGLALTLALPGWPRWTSFVLLLVGPLVGAIVARRRRPSEADVVSYVDQRLGAAASIMTTWEDAHAAESTRVAAADHLGRARPRDVRPTIKSGDLIGFPVAAGTLAAILVVPFPPPEVAPTAPRMVQLDEASGLSRLERLPELARTPEERERLEQIARAAEALRRELAEGMEEREALDALESLREQMEQEARRPDSPEERRARDAAVEAMATEPSMARALAERDLESLDRAVAQAAARREAADRQRARDALREAARRAREEGDEGLAESLLRRERLLDERSAQTDLARQLAEAMPELAGEGLRRELERLDRGQSDGSALDQAMVDAMREAWARLTPEERERLAEKMREAGVGENDRAREPTEPSAGSPISADEYERMLRQALEAADETRAQLGGQPPQGGQAGGRMPVPGQGQGQGQGQAQGNGSGAGAGGAGGGDDRGRGPAGGETPELGGSDALARVRPRVGEGAPSRSWVEWVDPEGTPVPTDQRPAGAGPTRAQARGESGGIERAPIPEDYEEHVRTYFGDDG